MQTEQQNEILKKKLQREFIRRCQKNSNYSLRAFANFLEVDQSFLSKVFNGQRKITSSMGRKFASKLGLSPSSADKILASNNLGKLDFLDLREDEFAVISGWHHFAILELMKIKSFQPSVSKVAQQLGMHSEEIKDAIDRLQRLGFIKVSDRKWTLLSKNHSWTQSDYTSAARRKLQTDLANKSMQAIENIAFQHREHGSLTVAIDSRRLPEFKTKLNEILVEFSDFAQPNNKNLDQVYQVLLSLFPLTETLKESSHEKN